MSLVAPFLLDSYTKGQIDRLIKNNDDQLALYQEEADPLISNTDVFYDDVQNFVNYLEGLFDDEKDENIIDVKLVEINDLDELEKTAKLLKRSFNTPVLEMDGQITVQKIESGSVWITLGILGGAGIVIKMCAELIWAAVVIYNKYKESALHEEHARTIKLKNDYIEALVNQQKQYIEQATEREAQALINKFLPEKNDPEILNNFKASIESIGDLIEKGAQFYPSIKASEELKMSFPDFKALNLIESKIKMLGEGNEE